RRARAHRLYFRSRIVLGSQSERQQLLDVAGATAARRRGFGTSTNLIDAGQLQFGDGGQDTALGDAVAAADLRRIRQVLDAGIAVGAGTEHPFIAYRAER